MRTIILQTAARYLLPLLLLFSVFILLRGHYLPGGGFVGGLIASIEYTRKFLKYHPGGLIPVGLFISLMSGFAPMLSGRPFMTGLWYKDPLPVIGSIGSALFFDIGVYFVVIGITLTILFTIAETTR
jgi:multicomponent Na+:H+ antiporter subunit B